MVTALMLFLVVAGLILVLSVTWAWAGLLAIGLGVFLWRWAKNDEDALTAAVIMVGGCGAIAEIAQGLLARFTAH